MRTGRGFADQPARFPSVAVADLFRVIRRSAVVIAIAAVLGLALGVGVSLVTATDEAAQELSSTASVRSVLLSDVGLDELEDRLAALTDGVVLAAAEGRPPSRSSMYAELMESPSILNQVAADLKVDPQVLHGRLTATTEGGDLISIRVRARNVNAARNVIDTLIDVTNARLSDVDGAASEVRLLGSPIATQVPRPALSGAARNEASARIVQSLLAENAALYTASALRLSEQLPADALEELGTALDEASSGTGVAERLTWGGAADANAAVDPAAGSEVTLDVLAADTPRALQVANATLDAIDVAITPAESDLSPLVRLGVTTATTEVAAPSQDRTLTNAILGILIGLAAGIGFAFLRESRDRRIRTGRQLAAFMSVPPIGLITDPPTPSTFQSLRSNVLFGHADVRTLAVTSPSHGDGTWEVARGLAATVAQTARTVVLVDTDMRRVGSLHMPEAGDTPVGLAELLEGRADVSQAIASTEQDGVHLLPAGTALVDPGDLLSRPRFVELLEQLGEQFDYVLCVTAPLSEGSDAAIVSHCTNAALVLVRAGSTTTTALDEAANKLMQVDAKVLGIVVTGVAEGDVSRWSVQYFQPTSD